MKMNMMDALPSRISYIDSKIIAVWMELGFQKNFNLVGKSEQIILLFCS